MGEDVDEFLKVIGVDEFVDDLTIRIGEDALDAGVETLSTRGIYIGEL